MGDAFSMSEADHCPIVTGCSHQRREAIRTPESRDRLGSVAPMPSSMTRGSTWAILCAFLGAGLRAPPSRHYRRRHDHLDMAGSASMDA